MEEVRYSLKYLADAYREFLKGQQACPRFKRKQGTPDGFTIAGAVKLRAAGAELRAGPAGRPAPSSKV